MVLMSDERGLRARGAAHGKAAGAALELPRAQCRGCKPPPAADFGGVLGHPLPKARSGICRTNRTPREDFSWKVSPPGKLRSLIPSLIVAINEGWGFRVD